MIKKILLIIIILGFTGCKKHDENRSEKAKKPLDTTKIVVQKPIKEQTKPLKIDNKLYKIMDVDIKPDYKGDINKFYAFIEKNYVISDQIIKKEAYGGVFSNFIIEKDGSLSNIEIVRDFGYGSGEELVRVLKLCPKWTPAVKDGQPVRCLYSTLYYVLIEK